MALRRRLTDKAPAQKPLPAVRDASALRSSYIRKRKPVEMPKDFDKTLLEICGRLARQLGRTRPLHADIETAYRTDRFRLVSRPTIEALAVGLWSIELVERWRKGELSKREDTKGGEPPKRQGKAKPRGKYRNKRRRLNYLISDGTKTVSIETARELKAELERQTEALIEDRLDRFRTLLLIGFMHAVGDDKVLLRTWRPLTRMLQLFFVVARNRKKLHDELHGEDLEEALAVASKNNIRGRVNYLADNFFGGNIPVLAPDRIFDQVYRTVRSASDS